MDINDLKQYSVIVEGGSGILFQPMNNKEYTYILTAKHNLFGKRPKADINEEYLFENVNIFIQNHNETDPIKQPIIIGETYYPHETADIAILKIEYIEGYQNIYIENNYLKCEGASVCGYPGYIRKEKSFPEQYTSYIIKNFIGLNVNTSKAQLTDEKKDQSEIVGLSGGGILKIENSCLLLIGIQSEISSRKENGQIEFVPVKCFDDIINHPHFKGNLAPLLPPYMASFEFLKDKAFDIKTSIYDEHISYTKFFLKRKTEEVIESNITPLYIKNYFKERLILNENNQSNLNNEIIYITWLEFLTIINIAKDKKLNIENLEEIFCYIRLFYKNTEKDWLDTGFLKECLVANYEGLKESGTVFIKTNNKPVFDEEELYVLHRESMIPRIDGMKQNYLKGNLNSEVGDIANALGDLDVFVFDMYNFIHFEYLKHFMIGKNHSAFKDFNRSNEDELLCKLRKEYGKLFGTKE